MTAGSAVGGAGALAHAVHYGIVAAGVVGLVALLAPGVLHRLVGTGAVTPDAHERRVAALRAGLAAGVPVLTTSLLADGPDGAGADRRSWREAPAARLALPLAVTSSAAAAGVHAAVCPAHLREGLLIGSFFLCSALLQVTWSGLVLWGPGATRSALALGALGNVALVATWAVSRTTGLPVGPELDREVVGPWDVLAVLLELLVVAACAWAAVLARSTPGVRRPAPWLDWHPTARQWVVVTAVALAVLSVSGASS